MTTTPEPPGKLDTDMVNGPEDGEFDWAAVDWRTAETDVRRLRQRIFTATQAGGNGLSWSKTGPLSVSWGLCGGLVLVE